MVSQVTVPVVVFIEVGPGRSEVVQGCSFVRGLLAVPKSARITAPVPSGRVRGLGFLLSGSRAPMSVISGLRIKSVIEVDENTLGKCMNLLYELGSGRGTITVHVGKLNCTYIAISYSSLRDVGNRW